MKRLLKVLHGLLKKAVKVCTVDEHGQMAYPGFYTQINTHFSRD